MAASKRRKGPARWVVAAGSALATAGFLVAIVNGPQPKDASASQPAVAEQRPVLRQNTGSANRNGFTQRAVTQPGITQPGLSQPGFTQPSQIAPRPRLRTRGS